MAVAKTDTFPHLVIAGVEVPHSCLRLELEPAGANDCEAGYGEALSLAGYEVTITGISKEQWRRFFGEVR